MNREELLVQAHREAQTRSVPVAQVLLEWLAPRMALLPTDEDVEKFAPLVLAFNKSKTIAKDLGLSFCTTKEFAPHVSRKFKIGKKGLEVLTKKFGRELTREEIDELERGAEEEPAFHQVRT